MRPVSAVAERAAASSTGSRAEHNPVGGHGGTGASERERRDGRLLDHFDAQSVRKARASPAPSARSDTHATAARSAAGLTSSVLMPRAAPVSAASIAPASAPCTVCKPLTRTCSTAVSEEWRSHQPAAGEQRYRDQHGDQRDPQPPALPGERDRVAREVGGAGSAGASQAERGRAGLRSEATLEQARRWNVPFTRSSTSPRKPLPRETARRPASAPRAPARSRTAPARGGDPRPLPRSRRRSSRRRCSR